VIVLAVDPGKRKCGVAVVGPGGILTKMVVPREEVAELVRQWRERFQIDRFLVGGSTASREVVKEFSQKLQLEPTVVDERYTTERARKRFFEDHPPKGWWRLVPLGLQTPGVAVDDYAAVVMAEDYLKGAAV
jgi:RNase H-fold protein (predicted Holliday junction resolvase)